MDKSLKAACIGEFIGTGLIIFFGAGCVAQHRLLEPHSACGKFQSCGDLRSQWLFMLLRGYLVLT